MAFNPFDPFRKNSKALMAALTIFVMVVFVLSTGGGGSDFFDWFSRQMGGKDSRGPLLGTIEGDDYYQSTLQEIRQRRLAANAFMVTATFFSDQKMMQTIDADLKGNAIKDPARQQEIFQFVAGRAKLLQDIERSSAAERGNLVMDLIKASTFLQDQAARVGDKDNPTEARIYRYLAKVFYHDAIRVRFGGNMYFGEMPNQNDQEALLYAMFLRLADKLDVKFSRDDVQKLIRNETLIELTEEDANKIDNSVRQNRFRNITATQMLDAIADEFRVQTARKIVRGGEYSGRASMPVGLTPFEFYTFYKDRCSEATFDVVDVPVEPFLAQVTEVPPETELLKLFDRYKSQEFDPARDTPGFKEPRRIKLEYVTVDGTKPIYKEVLPALEAASMIAGGASASFVGVGPIPSIMEVGAPVLADALAAVETAGFAKNAARFVPLFENPKKGFHGFGPTPPLAQFLGQAAFKAPNLPFIGRIGLELMSEAAASRLPARAPFDVPPIRTAVNHPLPIASLAGYLATPGVNAFVAPYLAGIGLTDVAELLDTRERVKTGAQLVLAPLSPLWSAYPVAEIAPVLANLPPDPISLIALERGAERRNGRPIEIAEKDLATLKNSLEEIRKSFIPEEAKKDDATGRRPPTKNDPAKVAQANEKARKLVEEWIKAHPGFETGRSVNLADKHQLADDPGLKKILEPFKNERAFGQAVNFFFFNQNEVNDLEAAKFKAEVLQDIGPGGRDFSKPVTLIWKIDDREAKSYDRYQLAPPEIHALVLKAWKTEKARELAKQAADELAGKIRDLARKELRDADNPAAFNKGLIDLAVAGAYPYFGDAIRVAKLKREVSFDAPNPGQPSARYNPPSITDKRIEYPLGGGGDPMNPGPPGSLMADQLADLRDKPIGETLVQGNRPKTHYYVSVMVRKDEMSIDRFYSDVFTKMNVSRGHEIFRDPLYQIALQSEALPAFEKDLIERLKAEMKYTETDELKNQKEKSPESFD